MQPDIEMEFMKMLEEARKLSQADLIRHASVSTNNNHECRDCFTCACEIIRKERILLGLGA